MSEKPSKITVTDDKGNTYTLALGQEDKPFTVFHTEFNKNGRRIRLSVLFSDVPKEEDPR